MGHCGQQIQEMMVATRRREETTTMVAMIRVTLLFSINSSRTWSFLVQQYLCK